MPALGIVPGQFEGQTAAAMTLLDRMLADAPAGPAGWNGDYGHGLLEPLRAANSLGL